MKTCMLSRAQRIALVSRWPEAIAQGVADKSGVLLRPGDLVSLPAAICMNGADERDVPGVVLGFAVDKRGVPSAVVHASAWCGERAEGWKTWMVNGKHCRRIDEGETTRLWTSLDVDGRDCTCVSQSWLPLMVAGVATKGGVLIRPGDLVRLPRNVARNRGSQLHAAGLCLGYAVGLDGSPCVVVDAVGRDVPELVRWRTWLARGNDCVVIDTKEAWRLEGKYTQRFCS